MNEALKALIDDGNKLEQQRSELLVIGLRKLFPKYIVDHIDFNDPHYLVRPEALNLTLRLDECVPIIIRIQVDEFGLVGLWAQRPFVISGIYQDDEDIYFYHTYREIEESKKNARVLVPLSYTDDLSIAVAEAYWRQKPSKHQTKIAD